jgi:hypothetical protein
MKIWVVVAKIEELQGRGVDKAFDSKEKVEKYSKEQDKEETRHFVNIGGIDRSVEELEVK